LRQQRFGETTRELPGTICSPAVKSFLDENFLLHTETAVRLYHEFAKSEPIIDYHCHLPPEQVASNHRFANLTEIWLEGDHYKWRAMRANGVAERYCTGDASAWEKFEAWAKTVPFTLRNSLYHWTHMELKFPFGIKGTLLDGRTARAIYDHCNGLLQRDDFTTQALLQKYDVRVVCTTDDPIDSLEHHILHARNPRATTRLYPTWRADRALSLHDLDRWNAWVDKLEAAAGVAVGSYATFLEAIGKRHTFFHSHGCRLSDHGLETVWAAPYTEREASALFEKARARQVLGPEEIEKVRSAMLYDLALLDHARGWTQQFHLGALRNNSTRMVRTLGPDTGFDCIGDFPQGLALVRFLDRLDSTNQLAKTIVYNLNPADNELFATVIGNFQDGSIPGKMQFGSAWWFLDQKDGMERQINALSNMGLLSRFVGMLTDSRSFLSYSRHDYFRRLLCNLLGSDVEEGLLPHDVDLLGNLVRDVCFRNAKSYFGFDLG
jgi:glucuronate isomerase